MQIDLRNPDQLMQLLSGTSGVLQQSIEQLDAIEEPTTQELALSGIAKALVNQSAVLAALVRAVVRAVEVPQGRVIDMAAIRQRGQ